MHQPQCAASASMTAVPCPTPWGCVGLCLQGSGGAEGGACGLWELGWVRGALVELKGMGGFLCPSPWAWCWWALMLFGRPGLSPWPGHQLLTSTGFPVPGE